MKILHICLICALFYGCSTKDEVMNSGCTPCDAQIYLNNGASYSSDTKALCCKQERKIDTSLSFKKVYIHSIKDLGYGEKLIRVGNKNVVQKKRFDVVFLDALRRELQLRGIYVMDEKNSPYTMRLVFEFSEFKGDLNDRRLNLALSGNLEIKNINISKRKKIGVKQTLRDASSWDMDEHLEMLVKELANKVADEISALKA